MKMRKILKTANGFTGFEALVVLIILALLIAILVYACFSLQNPGGEPLAVQIRPVSSTLVPGVAAAYQVDIALTHPLPPGLTKQFKVRIDEDDAWDDTLHGEVTVTYKPGMAFATGTFELRCENLQANGKFDLHGHPQGGTSTQETTHQVHAELSQFPFNLTSGNVAVRCAAPPPPGQ